MACPASLHKRIARMRRVAHDLYSAGYASYPATAAKEAERAARNDECIEARAALRASVHSARKALKKLGGGR
jgi:hypothetical protein